MQGTKHLPVQSLGGKTNVLISKCLNERGHPPLWTEVKDAQAWGGGGRQGGLASAARGVMTDKVFADKDADVDWDLVLGIRDAGTLGKLQQAEANDDSDAYDAVVTELEKHYATLCAFKVNKDDAKADVGNLGFLFELTQALFEVQTNALKAEEQTTKKLKDKTKAHRAEIKEQMDRIAEQDAEIEELQQLQLAAAATPGKGKGGGGERTEAEYKALQKQLDSTKLDLGNMKRDFEDEKARAKDLQEETRRAKQERDKSRDRV